MLKTKTKYIYNDYAAMYDKRYELVEGELYMVPAPISNIKPFQEI